MTLHIRYDRQRKTAQLKMKGGAVVETDSAVVIHYPSGLKVRLGVIGDSAQVNETVTQSHAWVEIPQEVIDTW